MTLMNTKNQKLYTQRLALLQKRGINININPKQNYCIHKVYSRIIFAGTLMGAILVSACGSGGGGGNAGQSNNTPTVIASSAATTYASSSAAANTDIGQNATPTQALNTQDLIAEPTFDFATQKTHRITVTLKNPKPLRYQVSFYSHYQTTPNGYLPHYKTQLASGSLINGQFEQDLQLAVTQHTILAELWRYDGSAPVQALLTTRAATIYWDL